MKRYKDLMVAAKKEFNAYKNGDSTYNCGVFKEHENCHVKDCGCECHEKGKDSAGAKGARERRDNISTKELSLGQNPQAPANPAPLTPFEEWLETEINGWLPENELSHAAYEVMLEEKRILQKHRDLCHSIDEEKLAEWMFEHPRVCQHHSWATTFPRTKQKYIEYAKEAIEYSRRQKHGK